MLLFISFRARNEKAEMIKQRMLEVIYSYSKDKKQKSLALPKLIIDGMDDESIWQQLELNNDETVQKNLKTVSRFLATNTDKFKLNIEDLQQYDSEQEEIENDNESIANEEQSDSEISQVPDDEDNTPEEGVDNEEDDDGSELEFGSEEEDELVPIKKRSQQQQPRKSVVDDSFFKLSEMEEFLVREDNRAMNPAHGSDDGIDYFANDTGNLEESLKYSDFFDVEDGVETESLDENVQEPTADEPKSTFELKQERLKMKIKHMENAMLDDKPWQLKGEVKADSRPQNSLLENVLEFDAATRPAPIITEEVTIKLEDIIRQRIKDKAFDDVERKVKPSDIQMEYKKKLVLDQEKSKQSLAQIYEKEYLKEAEKNDPNAGDVEPEEPKEIKEIRAELKDLFDKLDLLSNFYYTPRPAQPELRIITNLPTISMEEVAPVAVSDAALLAPEEIKKKPKGNIIGDSERTRTDKNRQRRQKKNFQRHTLPGKNIDKEKLMDKVTKSRNVEKMKTGDTTKSSSTFFSKLQENATLGKNDKKASKRKPDKEIHQAKRMKL